VPDPAKPPGKAGIRDCISQFFNAFSLPVVVPNGWRTPGNRWAESLGDRDFPLLALPAKSTA